MESPAFDLAASADLSTSGNLVFLAFFLFSSDHDVTNYPSCLLPSFLSICHVWVWTRPLRRFSAMGSSTRNLRPIYRSFLLVKRLKRGGKIKEQSYAVRVRVYQTIKYFCGLNSYLSTLIPREYIISSKYIPLNYRHLNALSMNARHQHLEACQDSLRFLVFLKSREWSQFCF